VSFINVHEWNALNDVTHLGRREMNRLRQCATRATLATLSLIIVTAHDARAQASNVSPQRKSTPALFPTNDSTLRRIWRIGIDSSRLESLAQPLIDSIGPRLDGSPGLTSARNWVAARYAEWGIPTRTEAYGTQRGWARISTHIDLVTPRRRTLEGTLLARSPGTRNAVQADVIVLPDAKDSTEFARDLAAVRGKFVLVSPAERSCRPDDDFVANGTPRTVAAIRRTRVADSAAWKDRVARTGYSTSLSTGSLGRRLEDAGAAGVITTNWPGGWGVQQVLFTENVRAPAVVLGCEDYGLLFRMVEHDQHPALRVDAQVHDLGEVPTSNLIAELRGVEKPSEYVVLSAHLDSWDGASGATDNGTGTLMMLEAMRILKLVYPHPKRTIIVGHWGGEESGLVGSGSFAQDHPEVVRGLQVLFNQDNGTGRVQIMNAGGLLDVSGALARWSARLPGEVSQYIAAYRFPGFPLDGSSDQTPFICNGAPGLRLRSRDWNYYTYTWHTNRDTYDKIVFDDLKNNAVLVAMLAYLASEDSTTVGREQKVLFNNDGSVAPWPTCATPQRTDPHP
jgi:carboxypeptidase Q